MATIKNTNGVIAVFNHCRLEFLLVRWIFLSKHKTAHPFYYFQIKWSISHFHHHHHHHHCSNIKYKNGTAVHISAAIAIATAANWECTQTAGAGHFIVRHAGHTVLKQESILIEPLSSSSS